jgi:hypothetical protein
MKINGENLSVAQMQKDERGAILKAAATTVLLGGAAAVFGYEKVGSMANSTLLAAGGAYLGFCVGGGAALLSTIFRGKVGKLEATLDRAFNGNADILEREIPGWKIAVSIPTADSDGAVASKHWVPDFVANGSKATESRPARVRDFLDASIEDRPAGLEPVLQQALDDARSVNAAKAQKAIANFQEQHDFEIGTAPSPYRNI